MILPRCLLVAFVYASRCAPSNAAAFKCALASSYSETLLSTDAPEAAVRFSRRFPLSCPLTDPRSEAFCLLKESSRTEAWQHPLRNPRPVAAPVQRVASPPVLRPGQDVSRAHAPALLRYVWWRRRHGGRFCSQSRSLTFQGHLGVTVIDAKSVDQNCCGLSPVAYGSKF